MDRNARRQPLPLTVRGQLRSEGPAIEKMRCTALLVQHKIEPRSHNLREGAGRSFDTESFDTRKLGSLTETNSTVHL